VDLVFLRRYEEALAAFRNGKFILWVSQRFTIESIVEKVSTMIYGPDN
jgi:hypothetical protein